MILISLGAAGCLPATPSPTPFVPSATATETPTPTESIVWFPPTATSTPFATRTIEPTPDMRPGLGENILEEDFTTQDQWQTTRSETGSVAYGKGELTIAIAAPKGTLLSLRKTPQLTDFYLEIDVQPSLCRGDDSFGLLLRASSGGDFYRLLINCNGEVRMERYMNYRMTMLHDWTPSGQIQPGGLLKTRLGVWALGQELRVFVNDAYQFTVRDPVWKSGAVGVFARSSGATPLTVNFSNMVVQQIDPKRIPEPTATPISTPSPAPQP